jgi:hypothetical protein
MEHSTGEGLPAGFGVACWICRHGPFGQEGRAAIGPDIADEPDQDVEGVTALESQTTRQATTAAVDTQRLVSRGVATQRVAS